MCRIGDIICINHYTTEDGKEMGKHSFVVIEDEKGNIGGMEYDFVAEIIDDICAVYIYADRDLRLLIHKEISHKRPLNYVRTIEGHLIRKFEYSDCEWKQYVNSVAIQEATKKIGRNIIEMCLRGGLYD